MTRRDDRYLQLRGTRWHYVRTVPQRYRSLDPRGVIRRSLRTTSLEIARMRRDALAKADDHYWRSLECGNANTCDAAQRGSTSRYQAACMRALAHGFVYAPQEEFVETALLREIVDRLAMLARVGPERPEEAAALLGGQPRPSIKISEALQLYFDEIAVNDQLSKSPAQKRAWRKSKTRAVNNFIKVVGDKALEDIVRKDAQKFYNWWAGRLAPKKPGAKALTPNSANRDLGCVRRLYREYFTWIGEENRPNPFRNLSFKDVSAADVPPFPDEWVREKILRPDALRGLNSEAQLVICALIETGCRPSEIINLMPEDIRLDADVPHIRIRPRADREIKTQTSIREIPLVGVSLEAMKRAPNGFPHYRDRIDLFSASMMKAFRNRGLFPTEKHVIYSFRHSFESRMLEAGLDYGLRCLLMGHRTDRPAYGDGGSLSYRRGELLKIAHPFPEDLFADLDSFSGCQPSRNVRCAPAAIAAH